MTLTPCLFMARNTLVFSVFYPHIIRVWGLVSFIFVRVFPQPSCNKREQASHFLFCIYPSPIVKKEFAENPKKSRHQLKLIIFIMILRYGGISRRRGGLTEGMYVTVPTNWATGIGGRVSKDAISEIMEALEEKRITIYDYDAVFDTSEDIGNYLPSFPRYPGFRAGKVLTWWRKV